jgi:very-short-patch-repair endonuclease
MSSKRNPAQKRSGRGDRELAAAATSQRGLVSVRQMRELGISGRAAVHRADVGRLHRVHRGVYAVGHEEMGFHGRLLAAVLACGSGAAISHLSAAALWGLRDRAPVVIDVIVRGQMGRKVDGIRAHRCRAPGPGEVTSHEGIPCTTPSRTLVDMAGTLGERSLGRAVEQAAVLRLLDVAAVDAAMAAAKGRRGMPLLQAILDPWRTKNSKVPRVRSPLEAMLLSLIVAEGLPRPLCNHKLQVGNRTIETDLFWPKQRLVVESDGYATHGTRAAFERDSRRDQDLLLGNYRVARFTWDQVEREPARTVATIARLLGSAD